MPVDRPCQHMSRPVKDVTFRQDGDIYCRRCNQQLTNEEIDPDTLSEVKRRLRKRNGKK